MCGGSVGVVAIGQANATTSLPPGKDPRLGASCGAERRRTARGRVGVGPAASIGEPKGRLRS